MSETFTRSRDITSSPPPPCGGGGSEQVCFHDQNDARVSPQRACCIGFSRRAHSVTCAECQSAPAVQTYAWDEPQGTGACADGTDRADRPFFPICNAFVTGRNVSRLYRPVRCGGGAQSQTRNGRPPTHTYSRRLRTAASISQQQSCQESSFMTGVLTSHVRVDVVCSAIQLSVLSRVLRSGPR